MAKLPEGTVTLLFTDIEGSTRLLAALDSRYEQVLAAHRRLLRHAFSSHGGIEVDTQGDALFYAFSKAHEAVTAAVEAQRALSSHDFEAGVELRVRMGIHSGTPEVTEEGYVGPDVHVGSRICSVAWGGQIVVSSATAALISPGLKDVTMRSLGHHALKDIDQRVELYQVAAPGLIEGFPTLRTKGSHPTNLPPRLSSLIGRDQELAALTELLQSPETSVVTVVGPGGTGKTSVAATLGQVLVSSFPDGVFFVDLSALKDADLVIPAIAQALSLREIPGRTLHQSLIEHLSSKDMLVIVDNFEQVMGAASEVSDLVFQAPSLKIVVTSREALNIEREQVFSLAPLELPSREEDDVDGVARSPAAALFVKRARAVKADFTLNADNASEVAAICRRLDGLPLALELAAARINLLSPSTLLARLDHSLKVLTSGRRDAPARQRTLKGAIEWSYGLLSQDEQRLFCRLGVFAGGFTLEAAEEVCDRKNSTTDVLDGLASLVDKSLVRAAGEEERFYLLETIREFALEMLEASGEAEEKKGAHADYLRRLLEDAEPHLIEVDKTWLDQLDREHDNFRAALTWTLERAPVVGSHIIAVLWRFWDIRGRVTEGRQWLDRLLALTMLSSRERMRATQAAATLAELQDDYKASAAYAQETLTLARQLESTPDEARALIDLGWIFLRQGDLERASWTIERAVALSGSVGEPNLIASALSNLGALRAEQQRTDEAISLYQRSVDIAQQSGHKRGVMMALLNIGELETFARRHGEARRTLDRVVDLAQELGDPTIEAGALVNLGIVDLLEGHTVGAVAAFKRAFDLATGMGSTYLAVSALDGLAAAIGGGDPVRAERLFAASDALRARAGVPRSSREQSLYQSYIDAVRGALTPEKGEEVSHKVRDLADVASLVRGGGIQRRLG